MSNHSGSYMLNEVLTLLDQAKVFELLGREATVKLLQDIVKLAERRYDCNSGEIMLNHGRRLGICRICFCSIPVDDDIEKRIEDNDDDEINDEEDFLCTECLKPVVRSPGFPPEFSKGKKSRGKKK